MKNWQITGFIAILIFGFILISGCTSTGSTNARMTATPTSTVTLIQTRTFTSTPTSSPTPALKTVLFSDDLSQWKSEWDTLFEGTSGKIFYSGGSLHIRDNKPPTGAVYYTLNKNFDDFILDVDTMAVNGTINNWHAVVIRFQDNRNYYDIGISADGYYGIQKWVNGNAYHLSGSNPTRSSYINTGIGALNHIRVEANKNTISLSVNGHLINTVIDNTFKEGKISFTANSLDSNSFTEVVFNSLVITTI